MIANSSGESLFRFDMNTLDLPDSSSSFVVHRADLHSAIAAKVPGDSIVLGSRLVKVKQETPGVGLEFTDGKLVEADIVIGADGLHSTSSRAIVRKRKTGLRGTMLLQGRFSSETRGSWGNPGGSWSKEVASIGFEFG